MQITLLEVEPVVIPSKGNYVKTKPMIIKIDKHVHCRICSMIKSRAMIHVEGYLHQDTCITETKIDTAVRIFLRQKREAIG